MLRTVTTSGLLPHCSRKNATLSRVFVTKVYTNGGIFGVWCRRSQNPQEGSEIA
ncbi:hypothetical protein ACL6C3_02265 [Capilliphycus salinus ALCB114379]|uniref:hypothetical protein n=1 Tax=Capilliphycus salinus TaxID=2768948 RepID=UPI0039A4F666